VRLDEEAAAELAAIPDTAELAALDRAFTAGHPIAAATLPGPIVQQMHRLVARYRDECGIDRLIIELEIAEAYANCLAQLPAGGGDGRP
jgi:hypothetical protein